MKKNNEYKTKLKLIRKDFKLAIIISASGLILSTAVLTGAASMPENSTEKFYFDPCGKASIEKVTIDEDGYNLLMSMLNNEDGPLNSEDEIIKEKWYHLSKSTLQNEELTTYKPNFYELDKNTFVYITPSPEPNILKNILKIIGVTGISTSTIFGIISAKDYHNRKQELKNQKTLKRNR